MLPLFIAYTLNIIDYLFTAYWVKLYGIEIEANPIARWMLENNVAWAVKFFAVGVLFLLLGYFITRYKKYAWVVYIPLTVYTAIFIYHIIIFANLR